MKITSKFILSVVGIIAGTVLLAMGQPEAGFLLLGGGGGGGLAAATERRGKTP